MLREVVIMKQEFIEVLHKLLSRLQNSGVNWVITGSTNLALKGMSVEPNDIDIQTDEKGAYEIEHLFSEFMVKKVVFSSTEKIRSHFGGLNIDGVKVEIMGDIQKRLKDGTWEETIDLNRYKQIIEVKGMQLPVLSLEHEYFAYLKLGRQEKAEMIKEFLRVR